MEQQLSDWVQDYLEDQEDFHLLTDEEKFKMFHVYKTILVAVHKTVVHDNVYPILIASNPESKILIQKALDGLSKFIPTNRITISLMH